MDIIWKHIDGTDKHYEISNTGLVRTTGSRRYPRGHLFSLWAEKNRYLFTSCRNNGKTVQIYAHKAVAKAFIPNPDNKRTVNHKDCNKFNNNVNNLEWCTNAENLQHAHGNGLMHTPKGEKSGLSKLTELQVKEIREKYKWRKAYQRELAKEYGISQSAISLIISGKNWKHMLELVN
jgi:hypothetical protein